MTRKMYCILGMAALIAAAQAFPAASPAAADDPSVKEAFDEVILPFMKSYCLECHNQQRAKGELDLSNATSAEHVIRQFRRWGHVVEFIRDGAMPPEDASQPTLEERARTANAIDSLLLVEARKTAGDPGHVPPRRLSNTEYNHSIRDLTGVDIQPTRNLPVDPAGGEGFDNTGEALGMSPSLLKKYLSAAELVASHMVLKTDGITFAPFPVSSYNERKKLTEQAIMDFYQRRRVERIHYLRAAWEYRQAVGSSAPSMNIAQWWKTNHGGAPNVQPRYLAELWAWLNNPQPSPGFERQLLQQWRDIGATGKLTEADVSSALLELSESIDRWRGIFNSDEGQMIRSNAGNWPIQHLHDRDQAADMRDQFDSSRLKSEMLLLFERIRDESSKAQEAETDPPPTTLTIELQSVAGASSSVIFDRVGFTKGDRFPNDAKESEKQGFVSLASVYDSLKIIPEQAWKLRSPAKKDAGDAPREPLDAGETALEMDATGKLEVQLSDDLAQQLDGKRPIFSATVKDGPGPVVLTWSMRKGDKPMGRAATALLVPDASPVREAIQRSAERFCRVFPNRFYYVDDRRGLAAGFHLVEGFFRDDRPLMRSVLTKDDQRRLDALWTELDFVTRSSETLLRGFVWFERSERHVLHDERFDFLRPEDPHLVDEEMLRRFERNYLERLNVKLRPGSLEPETPSERYEMIHGFFSRIRQGLARYRMQLDAAEAAAHRDLEAFAERAYRRPLSVKERQSFTKLYNKLRSQGQEVEAAWRNVLVAVLMSPDFCYRYHAAPSGPREQSLDDGALASRLSYFLWSSVPDDELLEVAEQGKLSDPEVLEQQLKRMLQDEKVSAFAREFFGQWLRYRDFLNKDSVNSEAFPGYTEELRTAMFEEPTRLATHLIQTDSPITRLLNSDETFVNEVLAKHYGDSFSRQFRDHSREASSPWVKVAGLRAQGRGGLFGMAVVLAKNSSGERTSPVKRGFWTVHHLLGQHFPPPPADVGELPANEKEAKATLRELLQKHTVDASCAMCHQHFDGIGLAMEGFDPTGRSRSKDLAGRDVDTSGVVRGGESIEGLNGLIRYVETQRQDDFTRTFCKKFLGYALGRSVTLSDRPLLEEMEQALMNNDYRFSVLFKKVVLSPQFRRQRGTDFTAMGKAGDNAGGRDVPAEGR